MARAGWATAIAAAAAVAAPPAAAQIQMHQFTVTTRAGGVRFDRAASLETSPILGLDATYSFNRFFSLGSAINVGRPNTRGEDFISTITFGVPSTGDTTSFFETGQSVNLVQASLIGTLNYPIGDRLTPFVVGGVGYYGMFLDPQINNGAKRMNGATFTLGAGASIQLTSRTGIQLDVRDLVFTSYDRDKLDPSLGRDPNVLFPEDFPPPPANKSTLNNLLFTLGFRYVPGSPSSSGTGSQPGGNK